jgi:capsular exopolysaccharide synthesis family protein
MTKLNGEHKLYALNRPKAAISEAFRMLRTNLVFANVDGDLQTILFTSCGPQEGKSTIISNLSVVLAQTGDKVLLMDCDLRKPVQHEVFGLSNETGLTRYLTGYCSWEEAVQQTEVPNLSVLTSGPIPPNPAELVGSKGMDKLMELLRGAYVTILIDAPPVLAVADPAILAVKSDGVIMVVRSGVTKTAALKEAREMMEKTGSRVIGIVLNDAGFHGHHYYKRYSKYYKSYYRHYSQE